MCSVTTMKFAMNFKQQKADLNIERKRLLKDKPCSDFMISAVSMDICERAGGRLAKKWCDPPGDSIPVKPGSTTPRVGDVR